jgi:exonuclease III
VFSNMSKIILNSCVLCSRDVLQLQERILCGSCKKWVHSKCTNHKYELCCIDWLCQMCLESLLPFNHIEDDTEFKNVLFNYTTGRPINTLIIKNDTQLLLTQSFNVGNMDIDPDNHFYQECSTLHSSDYLENEFNNISNINAMQSNFSIIHINARSLSKNIEMLHTYLHLLHHQFTVVAVTETWGTESNSDFLHLDGYTRFLKNRSNNRGGGVALFVKNSVPVKPRYDLDELKNESFEHIFVEASDCNGGCMLIGSIYRPPAGDLEFFNNEFENFLHRITTKRVNCFLAGDFNINLLNRETNIATDHFINNLFSMSYLPLITKPTHFTSTTSTLIDNIFTNVPVNEAITGILVADISDHLPVFYISGRTIKNCKSTPLVKFCRKIDENRIIKFKEELAQTSWSVIDTSNDVNVSYDYFLQKLTALYNSHFPLEKRTCNLYRNHNKPWITGGILKSIKKKHRIYKDSIKANLLDKTSRYKQYKNKLTSIIRAAERQYYSDKFEELKGNLQKTWKFLKSIISNVSNDYSIKEIKTSRGRLTDPTAVATEFNNYFVEVGSMLASKIPKSDVLPNDYLGAANNNSMYITPTDENEIVHIANTLKPNASPGEDSLSPKIIRNIITYIAPPLCNIFNHSLSTGCFPNRLKVAKVTPIFKADNKQCVSNYRPISVLPFFSKILEKIMYNRLTSFLTEYNILTDKQFGFREQHSTCMALLSLIDKITNELDTHNFSLGIFIDLSKAFDTLDHNILLNKLVHYGI